MRIIYSDTLIDHFECPRHVGKLDHAAGHTGTGVAGSKQTGGVLQFQLRVDADNTIIDTRFQAYGPPALIAAGSWLAETAQGLSLTQAEQLDHKPVVEALQLPTVRQHFAFVAVDAVRSAIQDYKDKQKVYS